MTVGEPRDHERARDRGQRHPGEQQAGGLVAPSLLDVRIGEPGVEAVVARRHRGEDGDQQPCRPRPPGQPRNERARPRVLRPASLQHGPHDGDDARREGQRDEGAAPATEKACERDRDRRSDGGADLDPRRVDARPRRRPVGHGLPHGERRERVPDAHADAHAPRQEHDQPRARRDRTEETEDADQPQTDRHRPPRAEPGREVGGDGGEEPHAEHRDRAQQPHEGVRRVEVVLDLVDQRPDGDDLRAQRERGEEQPRQGGSRRSRGSMRVRGARRGRHAPSRVAGSALADTRRHR